MAVGVEPAGEAVDEGVQDQLRAARAAYQDPDLGRLVDWVLKAASAVASADVSAFCLLESEDGPAWWVSDWHSGDFEGLGDPRLVASFGAALRGDAIADIRDTTLDRDLRRLASRSIVGVPVQRGEGSTLGLLIVGSREPARFSDEDKAGVVALAAHLGVALDARVTLQHLAELEAIQRQVVHQLQEAVRPAMPIVPNTELGVFYVAADPRAPTGGDLYDWTVLPDGDLHVAVVDVEGKGVSATKDALAITHALRLLVLDGCPIDLVVKRVDALIAAQNPDLAATLLLVRYSPSTGAVRMVGAGHPPPILVRDGVARQLEVGGIPIGYPGASSDQAVDIQLERRDVLVLYTDGLIEARKDILDGLDALTRASVEAASLPAPHLARALVERALAGADRHDDSLALVLRRRTPPRIATKPPPSPFEYRFTPRDAVVPLARHFLETWLVHVPVDPVEIEDILVIASELCTNAVRVSSGRDESVALRAWTEGADVLLEVEDDGGGFTWPERPDHDIPDPEQEKGRGLFLVQALADEIRIRIEEGRTIVVCRKVAVIGVPEPD
jgi:serine phosphatase RsbU (regulator of sigma subunit)/anti-sigma regulatory factor (Ser/Thr protein kinase)